MDHHPQARCAPRAGRIDLVKSIDIWPAVRIPCGSLSCEVLSPLLLVIPVAGQRNNKLINLEATATVYYEMVCKASTSMLRVERPQGWRLSGGTAILTGGSLQPCPGHIKIGLALILCLRVLRPSKALFGQCTII